MDIPDIHLRVLYDFDYKTKDERKISIRKGEKLFLIKKTNPDWWQVIRCSSERPFFVPASYVNEVSKLQGGSNDESVKCQEVEFNVPGKKNIPLEMGLVEEQSTVDISPFDSICINCNIAHLDSSDKVECVEDTSISDKVRYKQASPSRSSELLVVHTKYEKNSNPCVPDLICVDRCNIDCVNSGISSVGGSQMSSKCLVGNASCDNESKARFDKDSNGQLTDSLEKLAQEIRFVAAVKSEDKKASSVFNIGQAHKVSENSQASVKVGTYPGEMLNKFKTKLSHSRSFKTKKELQNISCKQHAKSNLSSSWEDKGISEFGDLQTFQEPELPKDCIASSEKSTFNVKENKSVCDFEKQGDVELKSSQDSIDHVQSMSVVPLAFQNSLYILSHGSDSETNKRTYSLSSGKISTESFEGCYLEEDYISDGAISSKSADIILSVAKNEGLSIEESEQEQQLTYKDLPVCSSSDDVWNSRSFDNVPVPSGWQKSYDEVSGEQCYISETSQAKWFSSADHEGRVYFFEENSSESSWTLPKISIDECDDTENKTLPEVPDTLLRIQDGEKRSVHRITKARSMLVSDQKQRESTNKSSSIPRNFLQDKFLQSGILKEGQLNRTKITENSKKVRKNWSLAYVVLGELYLIFYKDSKSSSGLPEIIIELTTAHLETGEKMSKRKNVFLVSTAILQVLCQCDDMQQAKDWCSAIKEAIANLNRIPSKSLHPYSQDEQKKSPIGRSRSLRVKNQDGSVEDHVSSNEEQQTKIRDRLRRFFHRRPTRETLASQGIYKDEPVFDNHLEKVCSTEPPYIPKFVKLCIAAIEGKEENMKTDGLYRASGNLSHVQKIRLEVDQNNLAVLEKEDDVHVLTGALKLFFRELKEPLIPYEVFTTALETGEMNRNKNEKIQNFKVIVKQLPQPNHDTLKFLLQHLRRVTEYTEFNRMHIPNLAIVFGPTLIWREKEYHQNMALEYMQQNLVIEFFLQQFDEIFK